MSRGKENISISELFSLKKCIHSPLINHKDAARAHYVFTETHYIFSLPHGRLFDYICARSPFDEFQAAEYIRQLLDVLHYLHNCRIAHLDIKVSKH